MFLWRSGVLAALRSRGFAVKDVSCYERKFKSPFRFFSAMKGKPRFFPIKQSFAGIAVLSMAAGGYWVMRTAKCDEKEKLGKIVERSDLPVFTRAEVAKHNSKETGIWVTFQNGVYDISEFVDNHPGGEKILLAAGAAIDPFWNMYAAHNTEEVREILELYRIGTLSVEDQQVTVDLNDPYAMDPERHPALRVVTKKPFNAETPMSMVADNLITPNEIFFKRNHLPVPVVDEQQYRLEIVVQSPEGGENTFVFTLEDLKKLPKSTVTTTIQCAGNRRTELNKVQVTKGLSWGHAAISTATWSGVLLRDVFKAAGIDDSNLPDNKFIRHVQFEGLDKDITGTFYGASIPIEKAVNPRGDVLLAYEMNGQTLPRDHGFPIRALVPGHVGARCVKWVSRVILSPKESESFWMQKDYKGFGPNTNWDNVDFSTAPAIQELPVQSAVTEPSPGKQITTDTEFLPLKGYAYSGGGRDIIRVDVSIDGGKTWHTADLLKSKEESRRHGRVWTWTLWKADVKIPQELLVPGKQLDVCVKAVDSAYNVQPDSLDGIWNLRGVLTNAWHHIPINVVPNDT